MEEAVVGSLENKQEEELDTLMALLDTTRGHWQTDTPTQVLTLSYYQ